MKSMKEHGLLTILAVTVASCASPPGTPEVWSKDFADNAIECGSNTNPPLGGTRAVFDCINRSLDAKVPFRAEVLINGGNFGGASLEGRVVGLSVAGTYLPYVQHDNAWMGPCRALLTGWGLPVNNPRTWVGCSPRWEIQISPTTGENARTFVFEIPVDQRNVVPWAR